MYRLPGPRATAVAASSSQSGLFLLAAFELENLLPLQTPLDAAANAAVVSTIRIRTPFRPPISDLPFTSPPLPWPPLRRRYGPVLARLATFAFAFHGNAQDAVQGPGLSSRRPSMDRRGLRPLRSFSNTTQAVSTLQRVTTRWNIHPAFRRDGHRNIYPTSISRRRRRHGFYRVESIKEAQKVECPLIPCLSPYSLLKSEGRCDGLHCNI